MQLRVMRSASMCSEDSSPSCSSEEELYTSWQPQYEAATRFLQTCLNTNVQGGALRWDPLVHAGLEATSRLAAEAAV